MASHPDWAVDDVAKWLRVTCLTAFEGKLFAATGSCQGRALDAPVDNSMGRVFSLQAGQVVTHERDLGDSWTHLAAIRHGRELRLYINGKLVATSQLREAPLFDLTSDRPLRIGFGSQNYFSGAIADLRLYQGALEAHAIREIMSQR